MKTKHLYLTVFFLLAAATGLRAGDSILISGFDTMKYSVNKIEAHPGQKLTVTLRNDGNVPKEAMGHNWVLLKAGVDPLAYATAAMTAKADGFEPKSLAKQVIASIPMLGPKESRSVTFTVPSQPGTYTYLCTFPAHFMAGMKGVLVVK